jgi:hypothetical protein
MRVMAMLGVDYQVSRLFLIREPLDLAKSAFLSVSVLMIQMTKLEARDRLTSFHTVSRSLVRSLPSSGLKPLFVSFKLTLPRAAGMRAAG